MLHLKLAKDQHWVDIVEKDIEEVPTDYVWYEQKAVVEYILR